MKFTTVFAVLAAAVAAVGASPTDTNANRLARGLPPLPPVRRATPVGVAKRAAPSGTSSCSTGPIQCCNKITTAKNPVAGLIISLLGIVVPNTDVVVGLTCSPISVIGGGGNSCTSQPVCCTNNSFNGLIAIGCSPINL